MHKKTTNGLAIATILIAYMSGLTLSNQAFAQPRLVSPTTLMYGKIGQALAGHVAQLRTEAAQLAAGSAGIHHTKQYGITKPPKVVIKRGLGCNPLDPRGC